MILVNMLKRISGLDSVQIANNWNWSRFLHSVELNITEFEANLMDAFGGFPPVSPTGIVLFYLSILTEETPSKLTAAPRAGDF